MQRLGGIMKYMRHLLLNCNSAVGLFLFTPLTAIEYSLSRISNENL